jgi:hypothetical protein
MNLRQRFYGFYFDDQFTFDEEIDAIAALGLHRLVDETRGLLSFH